MFVLVVDLKVNPQSVDLFMQKVAEDAVGTRKEPGCRQFDVLVDPQDRAHVMLYEVYDDEKAFQAHQETPHFKKYLAEGVPLLLSRERRVWTRSEA